MYSMVRPCACRHVTVYALVWCLQSVRVPCEKAIRGSRALGSTALIIVQHATQQIAPLNWICASCACHWYRTPLINALVGPRLVVISDVRRQ